MLKKNILIAAAVALTLAGTAARSENLLEVYQAAVRSDPQIREAEARRMAALEAKPQARGVLFPQLSVNGNAYTASADTEGFQPDGALAFRSDDVNAGRAPRVIAAAYTYNTENEKLTTNFAIDGELGALLRQGSVEGTEPVVSPNTGALSTVGSLGTGSLSEAHFDISDVTNTALAALSTRAAPVPTLYRIDLGSGRAYAIGPIGTGEPLLGIAIEP